MKKIISICVVTVLLVLTFSYYTSKQPTTPITVINMSSPASPAGVFAQAVKKAVGGDWYQSSDCSQGYTAFTNIKNSVVVYNSSVAFAALNKKLKNCQLPKNVHVVMIAQTPMHICKLPNNTTRLERDKVKLGMASMYAVKKHENQFNSHSRDGAVQIIPYSGSGTVLKSLLAGDIEWGWIGAGLANKNKDKIFCEWTTDKTDKTKKFLGNGFPGLAIPDFSINTVLYTADKNLANKIVSMLKKSREFNAYTTTSVFSVNSKPTAQDIDSVNLFVQRMYDTWAN